MTKRNVCLALILSAILIGQAMADVDLVTIPRREGTQLTIYNSEDITMVREDRLLTVKPGINRIQFSWANTLIDPTSIDCRILDHQDKVDQNHVQYFLDLNPGEKRFVRYSVTYKRRKAGPELNAEKKREPLSCQTACR